MVSCVEIRNMKIRHGIDKHQSNLTARPDRLFRLTQFRLIEFQLNQRAAAIIRYEAIEAIRQSNAGKCTTNGATISTANASGKLKLLTNIIGDTLSTLNQTLRMPAFMLRRNFRTEENADEHP
jgi:hypothetical protein